MLRLSTKNDQMDMLKIYDTIEVNQNGSRVDLGAQVAPDSVEPLLKMLPQRKTRAIGGL
jgi:hypothetical protein